MATGQGNNDILRSLFTIGVGAATGGTWYAYMLSGITASYIYPPEFELPEKYTQFGLNSTAKGIPIALVHGTAQVKGQYIWLAELGSQDITTDSGLSGTSTVTGFNYFLTGALGLCTGLAHTSRSWKNSEYQPVLGDNAKAIFYRGTEDQPLDPTIAAAVNNAVPYRGVAYSVYTDLPLYESNTPPILVHELHRYPFNANAGTSARVWNKQPVQFEEQHAGLQNGLITLKRADGSYIILNSGTIWFCNSKMEIEKTWTNSIFWNGLGTLFDADIVEDGVGWLRILGELSPADNSRLLLLQIRLDAPFGDGYNVFFANEYIKGTNFYSAIGCQRANIRHDKENTYISYRWWDGANEEIRLEKYPLVSTFYQPPGQAPLLSVNIKSQLTNPGASGLVTLGMDVDDDWVYITCNQHIYTFNKDTFVKQAELDIQPILGFNLWNEISVLQGGDEVISISNLNVAGLEIDTFGVDRETGALEFREWLDITDLWADPPSYIDQVRGIPRWQMDGTLTVGLPQSYASISIKNRVLTTVGDLNVAQGLWDLMVNEGGLTSNDIELTSLQALSDHCRDNAIGVSKAFQAEEDLPSAIRTYMSYVQGIIFENNDGKFEFSVFGLNDTPETDTIDDSAIATIVSDLEGGEGTEQQSYKLITTTIKDKQQRANRINVKYIDRARSYRECSYQYDLFLEQENDGRTIQKSFDFSAFSNSYLASKMAVRMAKIEQYDNKVFGMVLMPKFMYAKPGMVFPIDVSEQGISGFVRILSIAEPPLDLGGGITVTAKIEEDFLNTFDEVLTNPTDASNTSPTTPTQAIPVIIEQTALHNNDSFTILIGAYRLDNSIGGFKIWFSEDGSTYFPIGTLGKFLVIGDVAAAVDETDRDILVNIDAYYDMFASYSISEQRILQSFSVIGEMTDVDNGDTTLNNFEFLSFREVESVGDDLLLKNTYRGKYYTLPKDHTTDEVVVQFGRDRYLKFPFQEPKVGKKIYIKMQPFGTYGTPIPLSNVQAFEYIVQGYTKRPTHTAGLELLSGTDGLGSIQTYANRDVTFRWRDTARAGGISRVNIDSPGWSSFTASDLTKFLIRYYDAGGTLQGFDEITYAAALAADFEYTFTEVRNNAVFGSWTPDFQIGITPVNAIGEAFDTKKITVEVIV